MPLEKNLQVRDIKIWLKMRMIIHKPRRKAVCITVAGVLTGIAVGLILHYEEAPATVTPYPGSGTRRPSSMRA